MNASAPSPATDRDLADLLRHRIIGAVLRDAPGVRHLAADENTLDLEFLLSLTSRAVADVAARPSADEERRLAGIGAALASRNCHSADLLAAYQFLLPVVIAHVRETADGLGSPPAEVQERVDLVLTACNTMASAVARGYRSIDYHRKRAKFVRGLLFGSLSSAELHGRVLDYGLDASREYLALRARPAPGTTIAALARAHGLTLGRANNCAMGTVIEGDLVGFLTTPPRRRIAGASGIGAPRPLHRLDESFRMASRALETADRCGLTGVHQFAELGLLPAVSSDKAVGEALDRRYLAPLALTESAAEIAATLHVYLDQAMHVGRTAELVFVHPNTVRYRISRFEELAGVSLRGNPRVAFEVRWALEHRTLREPTAAAS